MSNAPHGQGAPYGAPPARPYVREPWSKESIQAARELGGVSFERQQPRRTPQSQSDSERRYADRMAQALPESLRYIPNPASMRTDPYGPYPQADRSPMSPSRIPQPVLPMSPRRGPPSGPPSQPGPWPPQSRLPQSPDSSRMSDYPSGLPSPTPAWPLSSELTPENGSGNGSLRAAPERAQRMQRPENIQIPRAEQFQRSPPGGMAFQNPNPPPTMPPPIRPVDVSREPPNFDVGYRASEDSYLSPTSPDASRPITTSSFNSDHSSLGSIPDFPVPQGPPQPIPQPSQSYQQQSYPSSMPQMPRRLPLGPPPSARKGPSSYYSQQSFVSPIVEEQSERSDRSDRNSYGSYASSNLIPSAVPDFYIEESPTDEFYPQDGAWSSSRADFPDDTSESGLVRQASVGKKARPNLIPVRSDSAGAKSPDVSKGGIVAQGAMAAGAAGGAFAVGLGSSRDNTRETTPQPSLTSPTALVDPSSSDTSLSSMEKEYGSRLRSKRPDRMRNVGVILPPIRTQSPASRKGSPFSPKTSSPLSPYARSADEDVQVAAVLSGLEKSGAIDKETATAALRSPRNGFGDKTGLRRPPRLDVDAVRDAEARGSLTSLPELIRRATQLAANLDRGRTASRLGIDWFRADSNNGSVEEYRQSGTGSLSDILASFPPPGIATPADNRSPTNRNTGWPGGLEKEMDPRFVFEKPGSRKKKRKCCGLPMWAFVIICIILILVIVAAVVIPITLIVLPRQSRTNQGRNGALAVCQKNSACMNGGSTTLTASGSCSCICANGFSGAQCTIPGDSACTNMSVGTSEATVGTAIPRLIDSAQSNFSIPLNAEKILSGFSAADLSCTVQNALVTIQGAGSGISSRRRSFAGFYTPLRVNRNLLVRVTKRLSIDAPSKSRIATTPASSPPSRRADPAESEKFSPSMTTPAASAQTINGVIVAAPPASGEAAAASASPTSSDAPSSELSDATMASVSKTDSPVDQDFSRMVILFILQETGNLDVASDAHDRMNSWFGEVDDTTGGNEALWRARNISLGSSGWTMDLADLRVTVSNGTTYGTLGTNNKGIKLDGR